MKQLLVIASLAASISFANAQRLSTPQASPSQTLTQNFGVGTIELSYSRPGLKGRSIGKEFVPFGTVWRTGANGATTIDFSNDVTFGGKEVKAGKYGLLSIPGEKEWVVILTSDLNVTSSGAYEEGNDVVRVSVPAQKLNDKVETFTITFDSFSGNSCDLQLKWDNTLVEVPITTNTDKIVMDEINAIFNADNKPYYSAASYYYENDKDINQAKEWIDKATADPATQKMYWMWMQKARIYKAAGDKKGAKAAAEIALKSATAAGNDDYVKMSTEMLKSL